MSAPAPISPIALGAYNPSQVPKPVLLTEFTARRGMMDDLLAIMRGNAPRHPCQHSLLIGPRGYGKTTSLYALKYRLEDDPKLIKTWIPLLFDEENYHIADLAGFWLECLRLAEIALEQKGSVTYASLHTSRDPKLEDLAREAFLALLTKSGRRALLLVDNLNDVLAVVDDDESQHRLRAFLLEESQVCLVGTASSYFDAVSLSDRPFYNLFRTFRLDSFTVEEMKAALRAMAAARVETSKHILWPTQEGYWIGLHILTGGNPRLVKIIYQLMERGVTADFQAQLEGLLDAYTPYFKHRIEAMSPQQRRVFDAIALAWDSVQISDISPGLRMESNQISAQIKALVDAQLIAITGGSTKRKMYHVADRFSNIYYFMRFSRAGRSRFEWFIRTMKIILTPDQYADQLERMRKLSADCPDGDDLKLQVHLLANAMLGIEDGDQRLDEGHKSVKHLLNAEQGKALQELLAEPATKDVLAGEYDIVQWLAQLPKKQRGELGYDPKSSNWWCSVSTLLMQSNDDRFLEQCAQKAIALDASNGVAWAILNSCLRKRERYTEAIDAAEKAVNLTKNNKILHPYTLHLVSYTKLFVISKRGEAVVHAIQLLDEYPQYEELNKLLETIKVDPDFCAFFLQIYFYPSNNKSGNRQAEFNLNQSFVLELIKSSLAANQDDQIQKMIEESGFTEALDIPLNAIRLRKDETLRSTLAPERLALVDAYLADVAKRKEELQKAEGTAAK
jgi:tetratricopeptide (TPR) repeat protein